ncbi:hypothetical protein DPMN_034259, partial [Dreissena polymorpha]
EDLESLRLAALATLKPKAPQAPQGIQVLSTVGQINISEAQISRNYVDDNPEFAHMPVAWKQAADQHNVLYEPSFQGNQGQFVQSQPSFQANPGQFVHSQPYFLRGRGGYQRGFHGPAGFQRGYGGPRLGWNPRGRGRGNLGTGFASPPAQPKSNALIVIQVKGDDSREEQPQSIAAQDRRKSEVRPMLLRPQDKWAGTEARTQAAQLTEKIKVSSKFRRYDDDSDSEEDDEEFQRNRIQTEDNNEAQWLESVPGDVEVQVHRRDDNDYLGNVPGHLGSVELDEVVEVHSTADRKSNEEDGVADVSLADISDVLLGEENMEEGHTADESLTPYVAEEEVIEKTVVENVEHENVMQSVKQHTCDSVMTDDNCEEFDSSKNDSSALAESLRQDDNASNSYSTFSRFNRRKARNSNSAEESNESDSDLESGTSSRSSLPSRKSSASSSDSNFQDGEKSDLDDIDTNKPSLKETKVFVLPQPENHLWKKSALQSPSSESSSKSDSDSSSSSDSQVLQTRAKSVQDKHSRLSPDTEVKIKTKFPNSGSVIGTTFKQDLHHSSSPQDNSHYADKYKGRSSDLIHKTDDRLERSSFKQHSPENSIIKQHNKTKKDMKGKVESKGYNSFSLRNKSRQQMTDTYYIEAEPEFDAANYRDDKLHRRSEHQKRDSKVSCERKEQSKKPLKNQGEGELIKGRLIDSMRHFKDIGIHKNGNEKNKILRTEKDLTSKYKGSKNNSRTSEQEKSANVKDLDTIPKDVEIIKESKTYPKQYEKDAKRNRDEKILKSMEKSKEKAKQRQRSTEISDRKTKKDKSNKSLKRRSIEEKLQRIANVSFSSESSDNDTAGNISSLNDSSSESESETWRNKKHGGSRDTNDIELEKRRRKTQNREIRHPKSSHEKSGKSQKRDDNKQKFTKHENKFQERDADDRKQINYQKKLDRVSGFRDERNSELKSENMKDLSSHKGKRFEETHSESESETRKKGIVSVVKHNRPMSSSLAVVDFKVSHSKHDDVRNRHLHTERIIVHVERSDSEDNSGTKPHQMHKKKHKSRDKMQTLSDTLDHNNADLEKGRGDMKKVIGVKLSTRDSSSKKASVHSRLGVPVRREESRSLFPQSKRSSDFTVPAREKRRKLAVDDLSSTNNKSRSVDAKGDADVELERHIKKMQEKNAQILRRKQEVEQDKQRYG